MTVFDDTFCVELTDDQRRFLDSTDAGGNRLRDANENDTEVLPHKSFGELVTWLVAETDLLVEHDASHWD